MASDDVGPTDEEMRQAIAFSDMRDGDPELFAWVRAGDISVEDALALWEDMFMRPVNKPAQRSPRPKTRLAALLEHLRSRGWTPGQASGWDEQEVEKYYGLLSKAPIAWKNLPLACVSTELLAQHAPDTVRGNMYLVVSAGWLPDTGEKSYDRIQRLLTRLRRHGPVPYEWIVDNVRVTIKPSSWSGLADFVETAQSAYRKDFWSQLPEYVEVMVEKDTVAGKLAVVTREYDVPLHPIRGYNSETFTWQIARRWDRITKPITVYYMGDHDPSGRDLERDVQTRLSGHSKRPFAWVRLAVNPDQFETYSILPLRAKRQDARCKKFVAQYGEDCAEVEAIPATDLRGLLRKAIESHIPWDQWQRLQQTERLERERWEAFTRDFVQASG